MRYAAMLLVLTPVIACAPRDRAHLEGTSSTRDSAGVRIVENTAPALPPERGWRVEPRPLLVIGCGKDDLTQCTRTDSLYDFTLVMGVARLSDGRIAVAVQGSDQLRFFDSTGKFLASVGRDGDGPGEFRQILGMAQTRGDTLAVTDLGEVEYFTGEGTHVRRGASRALGEDRFVWPGAFFDDGSYVGADFNEQKVPPAGRAVQEFPVMIVSADGRESRRIGTMPMSEQIFDGRSPWGRPVVFGPVAGMAAWQDQFYQAFGSRYEISLYDRNGGLVRVLRRASEPRPVTEADREAYRTHTVRAALSDPYHPTTREAVERRVREAVFAETFPAFHTLLVDRTGHLWVKSYDHRDALINPGPSSTQTIDVPTTWDVFDAGGLWLSTVELPARFTPLEIGDDYVAGLARDEDDVEHVRLYRLQKP